SPSHPITLSPPHLVSPPPPRSRMERQVGAEAPDAVFVGGGGEDFLKQAEGGGDFREGFVAGLAAGFGEFALEPAGEFFECPLGGGALGGAVARPSAEEVDRIHIKTAAGKGAAPRAAGMLAFE